MSKSFEKSSFAKKPGNTSLAWKFAKVAIIGLALNASYQQYTPDSAKDKVGAQVEQWTGSELVGEFLGHKAAVVVPQAAPGGAEPVKATAPQHKVKAGS